jgi:hypothetical protein
MKSRALLAAAILAFALKPALAGPAADFVRSFYAHIDLESDPKYRDKFVDPAKAKLDAADKLSNGGQDDVPCIDGYLALDAQDYDDKTVAKTLKLEEQVSGDDATVTAKFSIFDDGQPDSQREIVWLLKKVGGSWKVSDIDSKSGSGKLSEMECQ